MEFNYDSDVPPGTLDEHKKYSHPLVDRYASSEMSYIFSPACKFTTWRKLWLALAVCEKSLGISITDDQVEEMAKNIENIDFKKAEEFERKFRHDVMGHVHAFGDVAPK